MPRRTSSYPKKRKGTELCLAVTKDGVTVYGNHAAFEALADWMRWIARSDPSKHFEFHLVWHLLSVGKKHNVFVLVDRATSRVFGKGRRQLLKACDVTFMAVQPADLKALRKHELLGILPGVTTSSPSRTSRDKSRRR